MSFGIERVLAALKTWNEEVCAAAASSGHLEVLQWAHAHGCPWDEETTTLGQL
jgi:hypothetical protein